MQLSFFIAESTLPLALENPKLKSYTLYNICYERLRKPTSTYTL